MTLREFYPNFGYHPADRSKGDCLIQEVVLSSGCGKFYPPSMTMLKVIFETVEIVPPSLCYYMPDYVIWVCMEYPV